MSTNQMFLSYTDSKSKVHKLRIPVLPEKIKVTYSNKDDTEYVYGVGEVTVIKHAGAAKIQFESFFPKYACQGSVSSPTAPNTCAKFMITLMGLSTYATFTYTGGPHPISMKVRVKYEEYEQGGDPNAIYYTLTMTEYVVTSVRKINLNSSGKATVSSKKSTSSSKSSSKTYTVKKGDSLWNIAKKYYGNGAKYTTIYNANKKVIGSNPNVIKAGMVLTIP